MNQADPNSPTSPLDPRIDQIVDWEDPLDRDWLGAEAAVLVRDGRGKRPLDSRLFGVMLVSLGFAVGFLAGGLAWYGARQLARRKREP